MKSSLTSTSALKDRVAIVSGGAQGAGRGYSLGLAAAGAHVVVADGFEEDGRAMVALIEEGGGSARFFSLDVANEHSAQAVVAFAVDTYGGLDVLVNNAATYRETALRSMTELTIEEWDRTMAVFVRGPWLLSKAAVPALTASPHAAIMNHTSIGAYGVDRWLHCGTARGAVIAMTKSMAMELAPLGIRVNAIAVGGLGVEAVALGVREHQEQMLTIPDYGRRLIRRLGTEHDVSGAVVFLASDASSYMTGQTLILDGGTHFLG